ncbi:hypothetical protein GGS21DRAFT_441820 [Xylaria nigripes]|nr:hypothetical protein GGS21DRAFT_441820 [Xylaria nigripes]
MRFPLWYSCYTTAKVKIVPTRLFVVTPLFLHFSSFHFCFGVAVDVVIVAAAAPAFSLPPLHICICLSACVPIVPPLFTNGQQDSTQNTALRHYLPSIAQPAIRHHHYHWHLHQINQPILSRHPESTTQEDLGLT